MFKLEERKKARAHRAAVNAGEIKDTVVTHGVAENGDVIGDNGKPVPGTAAKGAASPEERDEKGGNGGGTEPVDFTKFKTHADLDAELAKLNLSAEPEGWKELKVEEKQAKLAEVSKPSGGW